MLHDLQMSIHRTKLSRLEQQAVDLLHANPAIGVHDRGDVDPISLTCREYLYHLPCESSARKLDRFGDRWLAPETAVWTDRVVMSPPAFRQDLRFLACYDCDHFCDRNIREQTENIGKNRMNRNA